MMNDNIFLIFFVGKKHKKQIIIQSKIYFWLSHKACGGEVC